MNYPRLKMAIEEAGMTQKEFGEKLGYSKNGINNLVNGKTRMDNVLSNKIVELLDLEVEEAMAIFFPSLSQK